jgi:TonB family protein
MAIQINRAVLTRVAVICMALTLGLSACGEKSRENEVKAIKEDVQRAYGLKDFRKQLAQAQKGLKLSIEVVGEKAPDTLYFAQAITEANMGMRNMRGAMTALKNELEMRTAAGQAEKKLQARRTLLIQMAEENNDPMTAAAQAVLVARGIDMGQGKDPQRVYKTECQYPIEQYRRGTEGDVEISYGLDAGGAVTSAQVVRSTPSQVFDQTALDCFKQWRFTPMLDKSGQPYGASGFKFTVAFRMRKETRQ